ncbi:MAG: hypothetical protein LBC87_12810 [Fibromonadaceae bacterium]|jgi:hypothetical protein|nr:hypothetical protein [Fibromonadaceae bacterium]
MENVFNILSAENVRTLATLVSIFCVYVLMRSQLKEVEHSLNKRIDGLEVSLNKRIDDVEVSLGKRIDELKYNDFAHLSSDFAHLSSAFEALTYVLEKNGLLSKEDKEFVDSRLAH